MEDVSDKISRREALSLFKAVAVLSAGLGISERVLASGELHAVAHQVKLPAAPSPVPMPYPNQAEGFFCDFHVSGRKLDKPINEGDFRVSLPHEMVALLRANPQATVQIKFWMNQQKAAGMSFGDGSVRVNQGMIQSKSVSSMIVKLATKGSHYKEAVLNP